MSNSKKVLNLIVLFEVVMLVLTIVVSINTMIISGNIILKRSKAIEAEMQLATYSTENIGYSAAEKAFEKAKADYQATLENYASSWNPVNVLLSSTANIIRIPMAILLFASPVIAYFLSFGLNIMLGFKKRARV